MKTAFVVVMVLALVVLCVAYVIADEPQPAPVYGIPAGGGVFIYCSDGQSYLYVDVVEVGDRLGMMAVCRTLATATPAGYVPQ